MSYKNPKAVYSSILLLALATGTAWANNPIGPENPAAHSMRNLSLVSSGLGWTSPFLTIENSTNFIHVRTGVFPSAEEMVGKKHSVEQVETGVFETPQGFIGKAQGFSFGKVSNSGVLGLTNVRGVGNTKWKRDSVQRRRLRKRGSGH
jgi:hypothetical protein